MRSHWIAYSSNRAKISPLHFRASLTCCTSVCRHTKRNSRLHSNNTTPTPNWPSFQHLRWFMMTLDAWIKICSCFLKAKTSSDHWTSRMATSVRSLWLTRIPNKSSWRKPGLSLTIIAHECRWSWMRQKRITSRWHCSWPGQKAPTTSCLSEVEWPLYYWNTRTF